MQVYLNGRFLPQEEACISVFDRGFLYGDGLFETIRVYNGEPFLWSDHMRRFAHGCEVLGIRAPLTASEIRRVVGELFRRNALRDAVVRITLSRGAGPRGYSPRGADYPSFGILVFAPANALPRNWKVITSRFRLPNEDPLAVFKHSNKLRQIVARAEADEQGANEALMLNERGEVVEGTTSNLFWVEKGTVCTPMLSGILSGVTRNYLLQVCAFLGIPSQEKNITRTRLLKTEGVFMTSSAIEVIEVVEIDGIPLKRSAIVSRLKTNYLRANIAG